jgi:DNA-binding response OmpR family regulator/anti-sigma regulatory factor (Ser/Thr protein kinase)
VQSEAETDNQRPLVLVADDEPYNLELLERILSLSGYRVVTARSGHEALAKVTAERPDIALLDVVMPSMTGYEVCQQLKKSPETQFLPVILVTALSDPEDKVRSLDVGADDLITKPVRRIELLARVRSLLRLKALIEEKRREDLERARLEKELEIEKLRREEETRRKGFYKEVIFAVTGGRLLLMEQEEFDRALEGLPLGPPLELEGAQSVALARQLTEKVARECGLAGDNLFNLVLCVSEAATNVIKHAGTGLLRAGCTDSHVVVFIQDRGPGIDASTLPKATLMKGYSTGVSLGFGFTIMLELLDQVCLHTSPQGTRLLLQMSKSVRRENLDEVLQRFNPPDALLLNSHPGEGARDPNSKSPDR